MSKTELSKLISETYLLINRAEEILDEMVDHIEQKLIEQEQDSYSLAA